MKKKIFTIAIALACVTTLTVGCGEKTATTKKTETKKEQTEKEKKEQTVENGKIFYANQDGVQIHEKADYSSKVVDTVGMNDEVMTIEEESNGFRKVTINGNQGYVATAYLSKEKITQTAQAVTPAPTAPVAPVAPTTPTAPTTTPSGTQGKTTTTKPSTTTTKKSSTPAPTPTPAPAPKPAPTQPVVNNCPYQLLTYTTYQGHYGFFYSMQAPDQSRKSEMMSELYMNNTRYDEVTDEAIYPTQKQFQVGYYTDTQQTMFFYVIKN